MISLCSCYRFPYDYNTGKLSRVSGSAQMDYKLADGTEGKISGIKAIPPIYRKEFATGSMSFEFVKGAWLQYLYKKTEHFEISWIEAQDALLNAVLVQQRLSWIKVKRLWLQLQSRITLMMTMTTTIWRVLSIRTTTSVLVQSVACFIFKIGAELRSARLQEPSLERLSWLPSWKIRSILQTQIHRLNYLP